MKKILSSLSVVAVFVLLLVGCSSDGGGLAEGTGVITVTSPIAGDTISSSFRVEGNTSTPDGEVYLRLLDTEGNMMVSSQVQKNKILSGTDDGFVFTKVIYFSKAFGDGTLEVFWTDPDGNETDLLQIPVVIAEKN